MFKTIEIKLLTGFCTIAFGETIENVKKILANTKLPVLGICLGNQILTLAAGGKTKKLNLAFKKNYLGLIKI